MSRTNRNQPPKTMLELLLEELEEANKDMKEALRYKEEATQEFNRANCRAGHLSTALAYYKLANPS